MTHTPEDLNTFLDEQQAIADAARPGEWQVGDAEYGTHECKFVSTMWRSDAAKRGEDIDPCPTVAEHLDEGDATFIAASRETVPRLIEIARTQQAEVEQLRGQIENLEAWQRTLSQSANGCNGGPQHGLPEAGE